MKKINIKNVEIDLYDNIGVSISGGADSAILSYILMKHTTNPIHFFTIAVEEKKFVTIKHSVDVIKKCIELTGNLNVFHHIKYVSKYNREEYHNFLTENVINGTVDIVYSATTSIPSIKDLNSFKNKLDIEIIRRRFPLIKKSFYSNENKLYHPFINLDKKFIKELYQEFNVVNELFSLTRSCESFSIFDQHCGECWWCEERKWAFSI